MGNALRHVRGESQKNIVRFIEGLSGKYSRWDIWQDFIIMSAIAIANTMGGPQVKAREGIYRSRAEKYSTKELEVFADMLFEVVAELERDQEQDFLGELFMALGLGNEWKGQFFTPYDICRAMSAITYGPDMAARIEKQGWISVSDPACGAGALLIAFANECKSEGYFRSYWNSYTMKHEENEKLDRIYALLVKLGYEMSDDEKALQDGTHELFGEATDE